METWRDVPGWEGYYQASDQGRVRSLDRSRVVSTCRSVSFKCLVRGKILRPVTMKAGYQHVALARPKTKPRTYYVHDLVTAAFVGPKPEKLEVCHGNGLRADNRLCNLRYDTRSANAMDRHKHGTFDCPKGESHFRAKLSDETVRWIRMHADTYGRREMGRMLGVAHSVIRSVVNGSAWKHVE